jgi:GH24 family phage-related lysozyme (muramidase)
MYLYELNQNKINKLIILKAYLDHSGLEKEAGFVGDLIEGAKKSVSNFWDRNKVKMAKAALLFALGFAARDYLDEDGKVHSAVDQAEEIFDGLTEDDYLYHEVAAGESLWSISKRYYPDLNPDEGIQIILDKNNIEDPDNISPGQTLKIPNPDALRDLVETGREGEGYKEKGESNVDRINFENLRFSAEAEDRLKESEGDAVTGEFKSRLYRDGVGKWTIGWGHCSSCQGDTGKFRNKAISRTEAQRLLDGDISTAEEGTKKWLRKKAPNAKLTQFEFDMLVDLAFNGGTGSGSIVKKVIFASKIDSGNYESLTVAVGGYGDPSGKNAGLHARRISQIINGRGGNISDKEVGAIVEKFGWKISKSHKSKSVRLRRAVAENLSVIDATSFETFLAGNADFCGSACSR